MLRGEVHRPMKLGVRVLCVVASVLAIGASSLTAVGPANVDGWVMLMRSRTQLGEPDKAKAALRAARGANPGAAARLNAEAATLGIPTS